MRIRAWWFFAVVAAFSLVGFVRLVVVSDPAEPAARTQMLTAALFVLVFGAVASRAGRSEQRARAAERSGPARQAGADAVDDIWTDERAGIDRWSLDQIAARLTRDLAPMNGVVFREGRSKRLRVMIDPASAIQEMRRMRRPGETGSVPSPSLHGQWWEVTWRAGRAPRIRSRISQVGARIGPGGRLIPIWSLPGGSNALADHSRFMSALRSAQGGHADLEISSRELMQVVDDIAIRSGWASHGQVSSVQRSQAHDRRLVSRRGAAGGTARPTDAMVPRSSNPRGSSAPPDPTLSGPARVMRLIGLGIVTACVLATGIGLLAGMVWWASFIIIGSGLLFCAIFVLPVLLLARAENGRSR